MCLLVFLYPSDFYLFSQRSMYHEILLWLSAWLPALLSSTFELVGRPQPHESGGQQSERQDAPVGGRFYSCSSWGMCWLAHLSSAIGRQKQTGFITSAFIFSFPLPLPMLLAVCFPSLNNGTLLGDPVVCHPVILTNTLVFAPQLLIFWTLLA